MEMLMVRSALPLGMEERVNLPSALPEVPAIPRRTMVPLTALFLAVLSVPSSSTQRVFWPVVSNVPEGRFLMVIL